MFVASIFCLTAQNTFSLKCLKILKKTLKLFTLEDRFFSWVTLILEQENIRIV